MKKIISVLLFLLLCSTFLIAEDDFFLDDISIEDIDFDTMFGDDEDFIEVVEDKSDTIAAPSSELLTTTGVEWGGSFTSSISAGLTYNQFDGFKDLTDSDKYKEEFTPTLDASLHFNARPTEDVRFFGKFTTALPFYDSAKVLIDNPKYTGELKTVPNTDDVYTLEIPQGIPTTVQIPKIKIYELFTDFNYENKLFFRVGKQNAKWGVGYFFSPADLLSLEVIDPENPDADREGPIAIKLTTPFGLNSLSMFITVPGTVFSADEPSVTDLVFAPMFQFLVGDVELSTGVYYQKDSAPRIMATGTYSTNTNLGRFTFFAEDVLQYGSDKNFIKDNGTIEKIDDQFFYKGTVGFMWSKTIAENDFSLTGQYLYNGEGYLADSKAVELMESSSPILMGFILDGSLLYSDLMNRNRHYLGANFGISNLFDNEDLSLSAFTMMNLVDMSGFVNPSISYSLFDEMSIKLGSTYNFSDTGEEYLTDKLSFNLSVKLGGGNF